MTNPLASSSSFDPFDQLCINVKNDQIKKIEDVKSYGNVVQIIQNGIESHKNDETCKLALKKLMKICEGDTLHDTISSICEKNGILTRSSLLDECKTMIHNTPGVSTQENKNGVLEITITEANEQIDRFFQFISKLENEDERGLIDIHLKSSSTQQNQVIEKYGKYANSLILLECIRDNDHLEELIKNCTSLNRFDIQSVKITAIPALPQLAKLQELFCFECTNLRELPQLAALQKLSCWGCTNLKELPHLAALQTLFCCDTPIEDKSYLFNHFLKHHKPNIREGVSWAEFSGENIYEYFNGQQEVHKNRKWMFNEYPLLFDIIFDRFMVRQGTKIPFKALEKAIDGGNLMTEEVANYFGIPLDKLQKTLQKVPFSENEGMRSSLIIKIIGKCGINPDLLPDVPKGFYFDLNPSEKSISLSNQQQAFCDLLCGCVRLAEDLEFKFDRNNPDSYPPFLIDLIKTTFSKRSNWVENASKLPIELRKLTRQRSIIKDAVHDYIKTVALAHQLRQHPEFDLTNDLEGFLFDAIQKLIKGVPINTIVKFSDEWHTEGRRAKLNQAKTFSKESWKPLFSDTVEYSDGQGGFIKAVPLTTTDQLIEEGSDARLKHCVGGYTNRCLIENCHIISLRDNDGRSLSTIDLRLNRGVGDSNNPWVINVEGIADYHLVCNQHFGYNNSPAAGPCKEIENQLFNDIREGKIKVDFSFLESERQIRHAITRAPDKLNILLVGYDPLDDDAFQKAKEIYTHQLSMMALKSRSFTNNFKALISNSRSQASSSNDRSHFV